jgi:hypothetical protein
MIVTGALYSHLSTLLADAGYFNPDKEDIVELGLIVGGSLHQPLHCDVCEPGGLEKGEYDSLMKQPHAPASVLIGMGGTDPEPVMLGVANFHFEGYAKLQ